MSQYLEFSIDFFNTTYIKVLTKNWVICPKNAIV